MVVVLVSFVSGAEIGRFVAMLRNSSSILKACAAFALLQVKRDATPIYSSMLDTFVSFILETSMFFPYHGNNLWALP